MLHALPPSRNDVRFELAPPLDLDLAGGRVPRVLLIRRTWRGALARRAAARRRALRARGCRREERTPMRRCTQACRPPRERGGFPGRGVARTTGAGGGAAEMIRLQAVQAAAEAAAAPEDAASASTAATAVDAIATTMSTLPEDCPMGTGEQLAAPAAAAAVSSPAPCRLA